MLRQSRPETWHIPTKTPPYISQHPRASSQMFGGQQKAPHPNSRKHSWVRGTWQCPGSIQGVKDIEHVTVQLHYRFKVVSSLCWGCDSVWGALNVAWLLQAAHDFASKEEAYLRSRSASFSSSEAHASQSARTTFLNVFVSLFFEGSDVHNAGQ